MGRKPKLKILLTALLIIGLTGCSPSENADSKEATQEFFAMDTFITFTAYGESAEQALADSRDKISELEDIWSVTDEGSEIYRVNHSEGKPVTLSDETAEIVDFTLSMAEQTVGALDPTIYPVLSAWGFTMDENRVPEEAEIQSLLQNVGYDKVILDGNEITLPTGMAFDLGAVGKGYAADLVTEILVESGVTSALLDVGGNIQALGRKPDGTEWTLGIRNPFGEGHIGTLTVTDRAVVTSGNYERYFVGEDGRQYGHIIDPATGYPADNGLVSVTIIADSGKLADTLSTSLFVMGLEEAETY